MPADSNYLIEHLQPQNSYKPYLLSVLLATLAAIWLPAPTFRVDVNPPIQVSSPKPVHHVLPPKAEKPQQVPMTQRSQALRPVPALDPMQVETIQSSLAELHEPDIMLTDGWDIEPFDAPTFSEPLVPGTPGLEPPVITSRVVPNYPEQAVRIGLKGYVLLEAVMSANGEIREIKVLKTIGKGRFGFEQSAIEALKKWDFLPGRIHGRATDVRLTLRIDFSLS